MIEIKRNKTNVNETISKNTTSETITENTQDSEK